MKLRHMQIRCTKRVPVFWATRYKVNILTRNIKHMWPPPRMKILLEWGIPAKFLSHASSVIINWLTADQIEDWISFTSCIRTLVYPEGLKGFNLHWMFLIMCLHENTVQALLLRSLYPKFFTGKRQELHTYATFTVCFRFCFILLHPRPLARSPFRKFLIYHLWTPCIVKIWVHRCHGSVSNVWFCCGSALDPAGELIALPQNHSWI